MVPPFTDKASEKQDRYTVTHKAKFVKQEAKGAEPSCNRYFSQRSVGFFTPFGLKGSFTFCPSVADLYPA